VNPILTFFAPGVLVTIIVGCVTYGNAGDLLLVDGTPAVAVANPRGPTVLLVYDPADCLACSGPLAGWVPWRASVKLLWTRKPTLQEERALVMHHLPSAALVQWNGTLPTPRAYLIRARIVTDSAVGAHNIERLIAASIDQPASEPQKDATRAAPVHP
jgi:hypothetical protein